MKTIKLEIMYRDGANWKTFFDHELNTKDFPKAERLKVGDEFNMGEFGTPKQAEFFNSDIHQHKYDKEHDHNILEVVGITNL